MRRSSSVLSFSPSLLLRLRIKAAAINLSIRQRCSRVWQRLINHCGIPTSSQYGHLVDWEPDRDLPFPEFWLDYFDEPEVLTSCAQHLERCFTNPSAKHHGH